MMRNRTLVLLCAAFVAVVLCAAVAVGVLWAGAAARQAAEDWETDRELGRDHGFSGRRTIALW